MEILLGIFFISLIMGQLGAVTIAPNVTLYIHDIILGVILLTGLVNLIGRKKKVLPKLTLPVVAFIVAGIISLTVNSVVFSLPQLGEASLYLLRFAAYAALYVVLTMNNVSPWLLLTGLYATGVGLSILGFIQYLWYPDLRNLYYLGWDPHYYRLFSTLLDPNFAGILIVLTFLSGIVLWQKRKLPIILLAQGIALVAIYLTYSRSAYLALVASLLAFAVARRQRIILLLVLVFVAAIFLIPKGMYTQSVTREVSSVARIGNWKESWGIIREAPIFGHGFDTLRYVYQVSHPELVEGPPSKAAAGVDSSILFVLATTGIAGFIAYVWILFSWVKHQPNAITASVLVALLINSLFNNSLFYPWVMIWFWVFAAAGELTSGT